MDRIWKRVVTILSIILATFTTSSTMVIYNKWLLSDCQLEQAPCNKWNFPFPLLVTASHMGFISLSLGLVFRFTNWCEKPSVPKRLYYLFVVPYSILVALDITLSNSGFLYLEASFVEMIKSSMPASVLLFSVVFGLEVVSARLIIVVSLISVGLALSSYGEVNFQLTGFSLELIAVLIGSLRLVYAQYLLHGKDDDDLTTNQEMTGVSISSPHRLKTLQLLYYQTSIAFSFLIIPALFSIISQYHKFQVPNETVYLISTCLIILSGAIIALALNICDLLMVSYTSALTCTVVGTIKTAVVVGASWLVFRNAVSYLNILDETERVGKGEQ
ncbi:solute carrier, DMT family [Galdieria sulphuraria]|uniref:Solute carrier, DMT family n=1 Tax=Galdieria sulphuraria TaxID=130081 RepID=M2X2Q1_GALSU|nr:solute carrier, DMT family [Galdieria sulphuraria]EME30660.1 solute carrier, DMT family [Galdieria sulphuraria]|eukprot:XP_005707180.1 solute carrier, DMT family [Galdieria sulphuraria]